jgi:hypothetical protein
MLTETFKNDYGVIAKPTSFSSIPFPATSINQSDTAPPSQTAYCHHHGIHSDDYKCTYPDNSFIYNYQVPFEQETEKAYESPLTTH